MNDIRTIRGLTALTGVLCALGACIAGEEIPAGADLPDSDLRARVEPPTADAAEGSCAAPLTQCGVSCVALDDDADHCGACGQSCGSQTCGVGFCNEHRWSTALLGDYFATTTDVAAAPDGTLVIVGSFTGELEAGGGVVASDGGADVFVAKLGADGALQWLERFGGPGVEHPTAVAIAPDGRIAVAGYFTDKLTIGVLEHTSRGNDDIFVALLDDQGQPDWSQSFGDEGVDETGDASAPEAQRATDVAVDGSGHLAMSVLFSGDLRIGSNVLHGQGDQDMAIVRLDPLGAPQWVTAFAAPSDQAANAIAIDPSNDIVAVGHANGALHVAKLSSGGSVLWEATDPSSTHATAVAIDGDILVGGRGDNPRILRFAADGTLLDALDLSGALASITGIGSDGGEIWVTGRFQAALDAGLGPMMAASEDAFLIRFTTDLEPTWQHRYGAQGKDRAASVAVVAGTALVAGTMSGPVDMGGGNMSSSGPENSFVAAFGQ